LERAHLCLRYALRLSQCKHTHHAPNAYATELESAVIQQQLIQQLPELEQFFELIQLIESEPVTERAE
jgi:hypothetical protein